MHVIPDTSKTPCRHAIRSLKISVCPNLGYYYSHMSICNNMFLCDSLLPDTFEERYEYHKAKKRRRMEEDSESIEQTE